MGRNGKFLLKFFHTHTYEGIEYTRKMSNIYFSRKRCLKLGKMQCKKTNKNEDTLVKQLRQY